MFHFRHFWSNSPKIRPHLFSINQYNLSTMVLVFSISVLFYLTEFLPSVCLSPFPPSHLVYPSSDSCSLNFVCHWKSIYNSWKWINSDYLAIFAGVSCESQAKIAIQSIFINFVSIFTNQDLVVDSANVESAEKKQHQRRLIHMETKTTDKKMLKTAINLITFCLSEAKKKTHCQASRQ